MGSRTVFWVAENPGFRQVVFDEEGHIRIAITPAFVGMTVAQRLAVEALVRETAMIAEYVASQ